jgi:predicted enzyme related to lactoylglutathione lyase
MKILMTSIFVNDPAAAFQFYTEKLGFISRLFVPEASLAIVVSAEEPKGTTLLLEPNWNPLAKTYQEGLYNQNIPVIIMGTNDIHAECERLKSLGIEFKKEPISGDVGIEAVFDDTCGNLVQLFQLHVPL